MNILAISGSGRAGSTNTALLEAVARIANPRHAVTVFAEIAGLPVFSPDLEAEPLPDVVQDFADKVRRCDGILVSSPEYVRAIPGGLKNAIDWLVSRDEIVDKPIALLHASHRGNDMLAQLRLVLATVSQRFMEEPFLRIDLMTLSPNAVSQRLTGAKDRAAIVQFLEAFEEICGR